MNKQMNPLKFTDNMNIHSLRNLILAILCMVGGTVAGQTSATLVVDIRPLVTDTLVMFADEDVVFAKPGPDGKYTFRYEGVFPKTINLSISQPKNGRVAVYLEAGDELALNTDFGDKVVFSGKGADNARVFYQNFDFMYDKWRSINVQGMTPDELYADFDAMFATPYLTLEANKTRVSRSFYENHRNFLFFQEIGYKLDVPFWYQRETNAPFSQSIPSNYWELINRVPLDGQMLSTAEYSSTMYSSFPQFLENEYRFKRENPDGEINEEEAFRYTYDRISDLTSGAVREHVLKARLEYRLSMVQDPTTLKPWIDKYITRYDRPENAHNIRSLRTQYESAVNIASGVPMPDLVLKDEHGNNVALHDFIGKVIYIDFWASWCAPCRAQMKEAAPRLHALFASNEDVVFLYINLDKTIDLGLKAIEEDNIVGVHLFAGDFSRENPVVQAFNIGGIPRYILISKDGTIVEADAPRPSEEITAELIRQALEDN